MTTFLLYIIIILASVLSFIYKRKTKYWSDRGIPYDKPRFLTGSMYGVGTTRHYTDAFREIYEKFKGKTPVVGFYAFLNATLMILDLDIAKQILVKDFSSFSDRGLYVNEKDDPLTGHVGLLDGPRWKELRHKLTPTFTSGKMKFMFPTIIEVGNRFESSFAEKVQKVSIVEVTELLARFTTDVIGSCAFGIECNSLRDPEATFLKMGQEALTPRFSSLVKWIIMAFPNAFRFFGVKIFKDNVTNFYMTLVKETVDFREKNNIHRNDFMDMLIEMKNKPNPELTINEIAAQVFIFFMAGFETSSTTMAYALHELSVNQNIQDKVRTEINEVLEKHNGNFTYECMMEMKYLDQVIDETLRKHSVLPFILRKATEDYIIPQNGYLLEKGTLVIVPADAIQYDEEFYPDPTKFDPDRFTPEAVNSRHPCTYLPFGYGPRNCIGFRFGKMQARVGLVSLLKKFKFSVCEKTDVPMKKSPAKPTTAPLDGIYLKCERI